MNFLVINSVTHSYELYLFLEKNKNFTVKLPDEVRDNKDDIVILLNDFLQQHEVSINKLNFIGAVVGPGSYTGLRVGLALANSVALALEVPLVGVSLFEILIEAWLQNNLLLNNNNEQKSLLQNKSLSSNLVILTTVSNNKGGFFIQLFDSNNIPLFEPTDLLESNLFYYLKDIKELHVVTNSTKIELQAFLDLNAKIICKCYEVNEKIIEKAILKKHYANNSNKFNPIKALYIKPPKITVGAQQTIRGN